MFVCFLHLCAACYVAVIILRIHLGLDELKGKHDKFIGVPEFLLSFFFFPVEKNV